MTNARIPHERVARLRQIGPVGLRQALGVGIRPYSTKTGWTATNFVDKNLAVHGELIIWTVLILTAMFPPLNMTVVHEG